jgi:hypothetical protein
VLLLAYFNYGVCLMKSNTPAHSTFKSALKIAKKFFAPTHFLVIKLTKKTERTQHEC